MPDTFGALNIPLDAPPAKSAVGDPLLDVTLAFVQAVVNDKSKDAWKLVQAYATPGTSMPLPISFTQANEPTSTFNSNILPALFAWRLEPHKAQSKFTQDWLIRESTIALLWVPPLPTQEQDRVREPFRNAVASAIVWAFERGRDPSWIVTDDIYFDAQTYGSVWRQQANVAWHWLRQVRAYPISLQYDDGPQQKVNGLLAELDVREVLKWGDDAFAPIDHIEGTVSTNGLVTVPFDFKMTVTSVSPTTGSHIGGDAITIAGVQFEEIADDPTNPDTYTVPTVAISDGAIVLPCTSVMWIDETTLSAVTPAHAAGGPYALVVTNPSGASSTLANAFTFT